eukprot:scaffold8028_cov165-Amphora_coffeaeformis.AAC.4
MCVEKTLSPSQALLLKSSLRSCNGLELMLQRWLKQERQVLMGETVSLWFDFFLARLVFAPAPPLGSSTIISSSSQQHDGRVGVSPQVTTCWSRTRHI